MRTRYGAFRNFRDVGSSVAALGGALIEGRLFRCGHLARLTDEGRAHLFAMDWELVVDLRYPDERRRDRSPWAGAARPSQIRTTSGSSREAPHFEAFMNARGDIASMHAVYRDFYRNLPFDPEYRRIFADAVCAVAACSRPALVHCTAGKDRTGVLIGLMLDLVGIERDAIIDDYLKSSAVVTDEFLAGMARQLESMNISLGDEELRLMLTVAPEYLESAFAAVDESCGSSAGYFMQNGVTIDRIEALRRRLRA